MTPEERRAFGARVAELREQRGFTQKEMAAEIGRTASWLSQVERGVQPVNRLDVLRLLADGLGVPLQVLRPDAPAATEATEPEQAEEPNDLDQARLVISGHPVPEVLLAAEPAGAPVTTEELRRAVDEVWDLTHGNRFAELSAALGPLVPRIERAARTAPEADRPELWRLLSRTYQALASAFVRQDEADAAWVAADRAIRAAEESGRTLEVFASVYRLAQAFVRLKHLDQAEHAATTALNALERHQQSRDDEPETLSVIGALHLVLALIHARAGDRSKARQEIERARKVARRIGEDRNDFNLEFGPTNVDIQAASIAVELGDAGEAIDIGTRIDASGLSVERRARLLMDLGRAYAQRRQSGEALAVLLQAEELSPDLIHTHIDARNTIRDLVLVAGRSAAPELRELAERADARP
ncbi:helix-turn-helix domain-containing protein [Streptacidiphilus sp. ASG 303]|uniref:helix-turn-helix domain-containing protein n=1 Tax=Streptacidiphilus sp. ASG 303 TaxID=2896847 RepID=UPI001E3EB0FC|nr:helix-turn-helix transcriptional regulator [Streptacidiphilus sp. ASG 303]MCD0484593.1 helix-turn-helix domain-containing protein [Streptacidiphilus sp. ASG 303]